MWNITSDCTHLFSCAHTSATCPTCNIFSSRSLSPLFRYSSSISGAWLVGGDSRRKDWPHTWELRGVPLTGDPSRPAELSMVSMTTADSSVVGHFSLPLRNVGWLTKLPPVNTNVSMNSGVTHPHDHVSWHVVILHGTEVNQQGRPFDFDNQEKGLRSRSSHLAP